MGLFDKMKKIAETVAAPAKQQSAVQQHHAAPAPEAPEVVDDEPADDEPAFDVAGFDPDDEDAFFNAVLHMESEGQFGGTDESRAEICARFGIRDRSHWHTVKESVYALLARKHGSYEEAGQREMNWRTAQMQSHMTNQVAKGRSGGSFEPVE